jgi:hypothetical protein
MHRELATQRGFHLTDQEIRVACHLYSNDYEGLPHQLWQLHEEGALTGDLPSFLIPEVWRLKLDNCAVPVEAWRALFATTRFTSGFAAAERPRRSVRLYRGATPANREGLSWTLNVDIASYFLHHRQALGSQAALWSSSVPPERLLAFIDHEEEYVADVRGLDVRAVDPLAVRRSWRSRLKSKMSARPF